MNATYGEPEHTFYGGHWFRREYADGFPAANIHILAPNDHTYRETIHKYNAECADCWLGYAHSRLVHDQAIIDGPTMREARRLAANR